MDSQQMFLSQAPKLLSDIAQALKTVEKSSSTRPGHGPRLFDLEVAFFDQQGLELNRGSLVWALDCLSNGLWWDETHDWHTAVEARLTTL